MVQPKIFFIELNVQNKFHHACDIIENFYDKKITATVFVKDNKNASNLDRQLWTWKQESFIPHIILSDNTNQPDEPIIITTSELLPIATDALILFDPLQSAPLDQYRYIIDFAEIYHPEKLKLSRERYKKLKDLERYNLEFNKLGAFLKTFKV